MRYFRLAVGAAVSLLCLWLAIRNVAFSDLLSALAQARGKWLIPGVITVLAATAARGRLWATLLGNGVSFSDSFWSEGIGYLFTNIFPLRMGDLARVFAMSKRSRLPIVQVATSAGIERILDVVTILLVLVSISPFMNVPQQVKRAGVVFGVTVLAMLICLIFSVRTGGWCERALEAICRYFPVLPREKVEKAWRELTAGAAVLTRPRTAVAPLVWSLLTWISSIVSYWCFMRAYRSDASLVEAAFVLVVVCLAITLPSSPGFIGVFQLAGEYALVLPFAGKYDQATALAIIMTLYSISYVITSLLGVMGMSHFGFSLVRLREDIVAEEPVGAPVSIEGAPNQ